MPREARQTESEGGGDSQKVSAVKSDAEGLEKLLQE